MKPLRYVNDYGHEDHDDRKRATRAGRRVIQRDTLERVTEALDDDGSPEMGEFSPQDDDGSDVFGLFHDRVHRDPGRARPAPTVRRISSARKT